jgi:hypothetical protein
VLGWDVMVFHRAISGPTASDEVLLASWQTGPIGLRWLDEIVKSGRAVDLGGSGYPYKYSIPAGILLPIITAGLPVYDSPPIAGDDYFMPSGWNSRVKLDRARIAECPSDAQLIVEAWDQS